MSEDLREGREQVKQTWEERFQRRKNVLRLEDKHRGQEFGVKRAREDTWEMRSES